MTVHTTSIAWLLSLLMIISSLQSGWAYANDVSEHGERCDMTLHASMPTMQDLSVPGKVDMAQQPRCKMNHGKLCKTHAGCGSHATSYHFISVKPFTIDRRIAQRSRVLPHDDALKTTHLSSIDRPPRT